MALSTTPVDINRGTSGVVLPMQLSNEVWANALEESAIMRLANRIELPGSGITVPVITGDASADWVAETAEKPVSEATLGDKKMTPYKIAVIELFSNEFRRDMARVYNELARRLPNSIGKKFDEICAPVAGEAVPSSEVNDPTFGEEMLGKGMAIKPAAGRVVAPCDATEQPNAIKYTSPY